MRPFSLRAEMATYLAQRDGDRCQLCGGRFGIALTRRTLDHIIPRARGGTDHPANLRLAHFVCNHQRGCPPPNPGEEARIRAATEGVRVEDAWRAVGIDMGLRRSQRRSRYVRRLRASGALTPGEVVAALAAVLD